ncbi:hypothetical protein NQ317_002169 [Molorchus minor]|uniref:Uncharacterized protein n=1 Tax=Molorchus minor TaxID=1323400 RepID=A0ABQ9IQD0_9CUCU|nr:hypothetical protein NQ317_002169 [Molorchus minor]
MGASSSKKLAAKCSFLSKDEQLIVGNSFKVASKNSEKIKRGRINGIQFRENDISAIIHVDAASLTYNNMLKLWGSQMDPRLLQYLNNYLFGVGDQRQNTVDLEKFAELFVFCTRGTVDEKVKVLLTSLGKSEIDDIPYILVKEYVESIVASYMKIQKLSNTKQFKTWFSRGCFTSAQNIQRFAESLTHDLAAGESITRKALEGLWLMMSKLQPLERQKDRSLVPYCRGLDLIPSYPSILDLNQIVFINANLPQQYQLEWRFLFSSEIHGESFSTLIG